ncbi:MAG: caspase family protein, partial [Bacteroidota bacterium]
CVSGDCVNGRGTYVYPSGAKYVGDFSKGEIHGVGVCYYTDGSKYSGQWVQRYPEGMGTKTYADGTKRTGSWLKGQPTDEEGNVVELAAKGEATDDGTDIQAGCISGDCENGEGIFAYVDGSKYEGQFKAGKLDGWGTWYYPDGDKYIGAFKDNYSHGRGTIYHADGRQTVGNWLEGEYVGDERTELGRMGCISGDCENGKGTYVYKDAAAKYVGRFVEGLASGRGVCYYANGERYEGKWAEGSFNGLGTLYLLDGTTVEGFWEDGTYMGKENPNIPVVAQNEISEPVKEAPEASEIISAKEASDIKVWAVIIGVASYSHMPALKYTDDDAYRMFAFLKSPEGGALSDDQIRILIDEDATNENIRNTMREVFSKAGKNDLVMLYFSGHGLKGSFLPIDFDGFNNKLFHEEINEIFDQSPAKYKLCIADACHSGSLFAMRGTAESALSKYYQTLAQAKAGTALIMSSKSDETSLESSGLRQGVFSHFLIRGLKGEADSNSDKIVSVGELYQFVFDNVRDYTGLRQSPLIKGDYDEQMTVSVVR